MASSLFNPNQDNSTNSKKAKRILCGRFSRISTKLPRIPLRRQKLPKVVGKPQNSFSYPICSAARDCYVFFLFFFLCNRLLMLVQHCLLKSHHWWLHQCIISTVVNAMMCRSWGVWTLWFRWLSVPSCICLRFNTAETMPAVSGSLWAFPRSATLVCRSDDE